MKRAYPIFLFLIIIFSIPGCLDNGYDTEKPDKPGQDTVVKNYEPVKDEYAQGQAGNYRLTIYNQGLGLVKHDLQASLPKGLSHMLIEDVAEKIDTSSVKLKGSIEVIEQNYQYDLVDTQQLLKKFIGKQVTLLLNDPREEITGRLLSFDGGSAVIELPDNDVKVLSSKDFILPDTGSAELLLKPTLDWTIRTPSDDDYELTMMYMTTGISWYADYILELNDDDTAGDLNGWVTINNDAGTTFEDAELKLMAGDINIVQEHDYNLAKNALWVQEDEEKGDDKGFTEESMFEYHMYSLGRPTTIRDKEEKQIALLEADGIDIEKRFVFSGNKDKVDINVIFENNEENKLGIPLPKGIVKVYKKDSYGSLQFIGENQIDHTPKDEDIEIIIGQAFDIAVDKIQTDYQSGSGWYEYSYEVNLRNHKDEDITVYVEQQASGYREWKIMSETQGHEKESQKKLFWKIKVDKDSEAVLEYTIRYNHY